MIKLPDGLHRGVINAVADLRQGQGAIQHGDQVGRGIIEPTVAVENDQRAVGAIQTQHRFQSRQLGNGGAERGVRLIPIGSVKLDGGGSPEGRALPAYRPGPGPAQPGDHGHSRRRGGKGDETTTG